MGDSAAVFAFDAYCRRIRECTGAYPAVLKGADAIALTAGNGEHPPEPWAV